METDCTFCLNYSNTTYLNITKLIHDGTLFIVDAVLTLIRVFVAIGSRSSLPVECAVTHGRKHPVPCCHSVSVK